MTNWEYRDVSYEGDKLVVTITPTYSGCPAMDQFQADIKEELAKLNIEHFEIKMQYDPPWTTDWIGMRQKKNCVYGIAKTSDKNAILGAPKDVDCPHCILKTELVSPFGSTACKAMYRCISCLEPFEYFKCL